MISAAAPIVAGAIIGALLVTLPELISDLVRDARIRRAERAVVHAAEALLRRGR